MTFTYTPPGVSTTRIQGAVTDANIGQRVQVGLVGESLGQRQKVVGQEIILDVGLVDIIPETDPLLALNQVRSDPSGGIVWQMDVDYTYDLLAKNIDWTALTVLNAPYILSGIVAVAAAGLTPDDYFYVITALRTTNLTGPVVGETVQSNEIKVTTTDAFDTITLRWTPVRGATGYRIYRSTTSGAYTNTLVAEIADGYIDSWTDTDAPPGTGTPPLFNNAYRRPAIGASYFIDYIKRTQQFFQPTLYTNVSDINNDFGLGSDIAKAAKLIMGTAGAGNGARYLLVTAIPDSTLASFQTAFDLLLGEAVDLLVPLSDSFGVAQSAFAHVVQASGDAYRHERRLVWGPARGTAVGAPSSAGTMRWQLAQIRGQIDDQRFAYIAPWAWAFTQASDGTVNEEELDGCFMAGAVAGLIAAQPDRATSTINQAVQGISRLGQPGGVNLDNAMADVLASEGALIVYPPVVNGIVFEVRDSLTVSADSLENSCIEIMMVEDQLRSMAREYLKALIGLKNLASRRDRAAKTIRKMFAAAVKSEIITTFNPANTTATLDPTLPTRVIVTGSYTPCYTIKQIEFNYSFDLSAFGG
jgi:hypothetical protein